jgi:cytochrome c553
MYSTRCPRFVVIGSGFFNYVYILGESKMKKTILSAIAVLAMTSAVANPYDNFGCSGCHGANGNSSIEIYPNLAGQKAGYIVKALKDFQSGDRSDPTMNAMAGMAAGYEQEIADFLAAQ